ncbi:anti-adapter protein IraM [Cronobacter malonaticus]|uniref:Anti-adapter protein IraM n=2 Tax=Cronobacter malonaticus TaxID=413503 RepID=A0ABX5K3V5_9ENTR|nr:anti-adapter protein IraM [Cronobacter malonaticus]EGT4286916.1 anti-adapter protein IraM [Cronobacter malonaticus]EGT4297089.1 anti-adapter protein IraM [Cronobacter malonaticus]EGT4312840.1 anti-adapter protein IraM [Cronobacter malonaticus]EGT4335334.1 anti-adapter protein IraM [Cronobacter malonaticus]
MESRMNWRVVDSVVSTDTNSVFTLISSQQSFKLILWYKATFYLSSGDTLSINGASITVNNHPVELTLYRTTVYNARFWQTIVNSNAHCAGNHRQSVGRCGYRRKCKLLYCPFQKH